MSTDLTTRVQELIDSTINPAVAGHGGFVQLIDVKENKVYLQMGGGCQGCGAADVTKRRRVATIRLVPISMRGGGRRRGRAAAQRTKLTPRSALRPVCVPLSSASTLTPVSAVIAHESNAQVATGPASRSYF